MNGLMQKPLVKNWLPSMFLLPVVILLLINSGKFIPILDHINLLFHEGGHGVFRLFGGFIYTLGGTLMQIFIPVLFIFYFHTNGKRIGTQISLVYLGQNLLNISVYAADAEQQALPLLGGNKVYHDWNRMLTDLNLLNHAEAVGNLFYFAAVLVFILALLFPLINKEYTRTDIQMDL